jgi:hypothetical protein
MEIHSTLIKKAHITSTGRLAQFWNSMNISTYPITDQPFPWQEVTSHFHVRKWHHISMTGSDITSPWQEVTSHDWYPSLIFSLVQTWNNWGSGQAKEFLWRQIFTCGCEPPSDVKCTPPTLGYSPSVPTDSEIYPIVPKHITLH